VRRIDLRLAFDAELFKDRAEFLAEAGERLF
jgi:hypothetical protein